MNEKDMKMNYGMYTPEGNAAVDNIVRAALVNDLRWSAVYSLLYQVSRTQGFEEALDTDVREAVYFAIGGEVRDEEFFDV
jgi:hypothetical protein